MRHSRSVRTPSAAEEGHERDLALAPAVVRTAGSTGLPDRDEYDDADDLGDDLTDGELTVPADLVDLADLADVVRLACPDCARPIAVDGEDTVLPPHAVCPNPWQPFGLTVCAGSGRAVADAGPLEPLVVAPAPEDFLAAATALPSGLDWRTQPFSHVGGPGSRPLRVPPQRVSPLAA